MTCGGTNLCEHIYSSVYIVGLQSFAGRFLCRFNRLWLAPGKVLQTTHAKVAK